MHNRRSPCLSFFLGLLIFFTSAKLLAQKGTEANHIREVTLLFTNDFESAFDPIPAYWRDDIEYLGGAAELTTMIDSIRQSESLVYLFDAGDMFTGTLSNRTQGELLMEMMITMKYDAMAIGNHEFDYGWRNFRDQMNRVPFPVLGANIFYKGTNIPFAQPYAVIEKDGFRIGVIGIIGQDARSVVIASNVDSLDFTAPKEAVAKAVHMLEPEVDVIVLLTHQGKTGPMQTDQEAHPEVWRDFDADIKLSGAVKNIDVHFAGHAHRGIEEPFVHPKTGTVIMQTYGHATRLGYLKLEVDTKMNEVISHQGGLLLVESKKYAPNPTMKEKIEDYRARFPELQEVICRSNARLVRKYNEESDLGNLFTDILRETTGTDLAFFNSGGLRADLPEGDITIADMLDAFPFQDKIWKLEMTGGQIKELLEQSFTLERGILQSSGLVARYDLSLPFGQRLVSLHVNDEPVKDDQLFSVSTIGVIAEGGDNYKTFTQAKVLEDSGPFYGQVLEAALKDKKLVDIPTKGRLIRND
ncbi:MAG: bifunctional metallophosphatase/5'-nucleotidase [Cyclobacteriaceae bacterium]